MLLVSSEIRYWEWLEHPSIPMANLNSISLPKCLPARFSTRSHSLMVWFSALSSF